MMNGLIKYLLSTYLLHMHCPGHWGQVGNKTDCLLSWYLHSGGGDSIAVNKRIPQIMSEIRATKIIKEMMAWNLWSDQWEPF